MLLASGCIGIDLLNNDLRHDLNIHLDFFVSHFVKKLTQFSELNLQTFCLYSNFQKTFQTNIYIYIYIYMLDLHKFLFHNLPSSLYMLQLKELKDQPYFLLEGY